MTDLDRTSESRPTDLFCVSGSSPTQPLLTALPKFPHDSFSNDSTEIEEIRTDSEISFYAKSGSSPTRVLFSTPPESSHASVPLQAQPEPQQAPTETDITFFACSGSSPGCERADWPSSGWTSVHSVPFKVSFWREVTRPQKSKGTSRFKKVSDGSSTNSPRTVRFNRRLYEIK
jgi:hypothetical protein